MGQCWCRVPGDGADSGALGVMWGRVLGRLSRNVGPQGFLFMMEEVPVALATVEVGHNEG